MKNYLFYRKNIKNTCICEKCGMKMDRDQNAAMNIVARAICGNH